MINSLPLSTGEKGSRRLTVLMAPKKRKEAETPKETGAEAPSPRKTRSSSRRAAEQTEAPAHQRPSKKSKPSKKKEDPNVSTKPDATDVARSDADLPKAEGDSAGAVVSKTIIVEACKQCNSFKTRALQVKQGLESGVPGVIVKVNPDKPRRGCFEIREESGKTFISLLGMPRPFTKMKALDMNEVIADIIKSIS